MSPEKVARKEYPLSTDGRLFLESLGEKYQPETYLETEDGYLWFVYGEDQTGLTLACLHSFETGVTLTSPIANRKNRTSAHKAWGGARQSRAAGPPWEIYSEMGEEGVDPDKKAGGVFRNYGHKSVGDMARMMIDMHDVPMHFCFEQFYDAATNAGQEKSTRYQPEFGEAVLQEIRHFLDNDVAEEEINKLEGKCQAIGTMSLVFFERHKERLLRSFTEHFKPESQKEIDGLESRVLDCARSFLLFGQRTGMSNDMSARDWSRYVADLKASPIEFYQKMGSHIERFLTPTKTEEKKLQFKAEAPSLIRHTEATPTTNNNLAFLREFVLGETSLLDSVDINVEFDEVLPTADMLPFKYTEGDKMVAQYLLTLWPGMNRDQLLDWVHNQDDEVKKKISGVITKDHHCNNELSVLATTRGMTIVYEGAVAEARDENRHRAAGRFAPLPMIFAADIDAETVLQVLARGYTLPAYLTHMSEFADECEEFRTDMLILYSHIFDLVKEVYANHGNNINYSFVYNLLPLAHTVDFWMHLDPKGAHYMPDRRTRPGGHVNYIVQNARANELIAGSDPYLSSYKLPQPKPFSREDFFNRA